MGLRCEIVVEGRLGPRFDALVDGFDVSECDQGNTRLTGSLPDRSALRDVLGRLDDCGIGLLALETSPVGEGAS